MKKKYTDDERDIVDILSGETDENESPAETIDLEEPQDEDSEYDGEEKKKARLELYDWMQCLVMAVVCAIFFFVFVGRPIFVEGHSMVDTLHWNDMVIMSGLFYTPNYGDIVIFRADKDAFGDTPLVKRVIATEGQTVDINFETGEVVVDGFILEEEHYINEPTHSRLSFDGPVEVPAGKVFVLGDNRNHSSDSRDSRVGMVDVRDILGKVYFLLIPGQSGGDQRDWGRFGFVW